jgi:hypothetical protein
MKIHNNKPRDKNETYEIDDKLYEDQNCEGLDKILI